MSNALRYVKEHVFRIGCAIHPVWFLRHTAKYKGVPYKTYWVLVTNSGVIYARFEGATANSPKSFMNPALLVRQKLGYPHCQSAPKYPPANVFSPDAADWGDLNYKDRWKERGKRDVEEEEDLRNLASTYRDERQFQTKLFGDVEVVVKGKFPAEKPQASAIKGVP